MASDMSVSVLVPAYNAEQTIARALESVYAQDVEVAELVVVDDGSSDKTAQIVTEQFPQARLLRQENSGPSAARNAGIAAVEGEWIAFLDADDAWFPDKLRRQFEALASDRDVALCSCDWVRTASLRGQIVEPVAIERYTWREILRLNRFQTSTALMRTQLARDIQGFRKQLDGAEDWDFWLRASRRTDVLHLRAPLVVYSDLSTGYSKNLRRVYDTMQQMLDEWAPPDGPLRGPDFHDLVAWHDVRFAYNFWREGQRQNAAAALRHARQATSYRALLHAGFGEFLPFMLRRVTRKLRR